MSAAERRESVRRRVLIGQGNESAKNLLDPYLKRWRTSYGIFHPIGLAPVQPTSTSYSYDRGKKLYFFLLQIDS
jgi:hypothetical protein